MRRYRLAAACLIVLSFGAIGQARSVEAFPAGDVFKPPLADPAQPRSFVSFLEVETAAERLTTASVGIGYSFGLLRWTGEAPGDGWQAGISGAAFSQFDLDSAADDLVNTDFRIGLPLSYRRGRFSARARLWHQSSHLGDEFILGGNAPPRVGLSMEVFDFLLAWDWGQWRGYGGASHRVRGGPEQLERTGAQAGVDYTSRDPLLAGARLVAGADVKWLQEAHWHEGRSVKIGLQFGRPEPERRGLTLLLEAYEGFAPFGQFFDEDIRYYGFGLQIDF